MNKLLALVKFNQGQALVLQDEIKMIYKKHGDLIIGTDSTGTFLDCYCYERPTQYSKAFGGREFDLPLEDGTVLKCFGQWWSGGFSRAKEILQEDIVSVTAHDIEGLKSCYVYRGYHAIASKLQELESTYTGKIYTYNEYRDVLRDQK
jgi:hypothetical protein